MSYDLNHSCETIPESLRSPEWFFIQFKWTAPPVTDNCSSNISWWGDRDTVWTRVYYLRLTFTVSVWRTLPWDTTPDSGFVFQHWLIYIVWKWTLYKKNLHFWICLFYLCSLTLFFELKKCSGGNKHSLIFPSFLESYPDRALPEHVCNTFPFQVTGG